MNFRSHLAANLKVSTYPGKRLLHNLRSKRGSASSEIDGLNGSISPLSPIPIKFLQNGTLVDTAQVSVIGMLHIRTEGTNPGAEGQMYIEIQFLRHCRYNRWLPLKDE